VRGEAAAAGDSIQWGTQLVCANGSWWTVVVLENRSKVPLSVVLKTTEV
jgi:hypothetical protein